MTSCWVRWSAVAVSSGTANAATTARARATRTTSSRVRTGSAPAEPVAEAADGGEQPRPVQLRAQLRQVDVEGAGDREVRVAPDLVHQLLPADRGAGAGGEHRQDLELLGGEADVVPRHEDAAGAEVDLDVLDAHDVP